MWPRAAALAYRCWGDGKDFETYFGQRRAQLEALGITIREIDAGQRVNIAHLGIGEYHRGFDTAEIMQFLEESAIAGEVAEFN